ncbi:MAG: hypothetical protein ACFB10_06985 [Salibacteraceae bacterium]
MSFSTFGLDAIKRARTHFKTANKPSYFELKDTLTRPNCYRTTEIEAAPPEVLETIRKQLKQERKEEVLLKILLLIGAIAITLLLAVVLIHVVLPGLFEFDVIFRNEAAGIAHPRS